MFACILFLLRAILAGSGFAAISASVLAQGYPAKPIRVVIPFPPGGVDLVVRLMQQRLNAGLGQPIVIENRAGATGMIGTALVARAAPDGYTLLHVPGAGLALRKFVSVNPVPDMLKDLTPIATTVDVATFIVVGASVPVSTMKELVDYAKKNPGKLNYGSAGIASTQHLMGELLVQNGVDMVHVPFPGIAPALAALLGDSIQMSFHALASVNGAVKEGKLKVLATPLAKRYEGAPQIPTVNEILPAFEMPQYWMGFFGPPALPQAIVSRINSEVGKALEAAEVAAKLSEQDFIVIKTAPDQITGFVKSSVDAYERLLSKVKIPPQ